MNYAVRNAPRRFNHIPNSSYNYRTTKNGTDLFNGRGYTYPINWMTIVGGTITNYTYYVRLTNSVSATGNCYGNTTYQSSSAGIYYFTFKFTKGTSVSGSVYLGNTTTYDKYLSFTGLTNASETTYGAFFYCDSAETLRITFINGDSTPTYYSDYGYFCIYPVVPCIDTSGTSTKSYSQRVASSNYSSQINEAIKENGSNDFPSSCTYTVTSGTGITDYGVSGSNQSSIVPLNMPQMLLGVSTGIIDLTDKRTIMQYNLWNSIKNSNNTYKQLYYSCNLKSSVGSLNCASFVYYTGTSRIPSSTGWESSFNSTQRSVAFAFPYQYTNYEGNVSSPYFRGGFTPKIYLDITSSLTVSVKNQSLVLSDSLTGCPPPVYDVCKDEELTECNISILSSKLTTTSYTGSISSSFTSDTTGTINLHCCGIPRRSKCVLISMTISSTASYSGENYVAFRKSGTSYLQYFNSISGRTNNYSRTYCGWVDIDVNGKIDYIVKTNGTLTISQCKIIGAKV